MLDENLLITKAKEGDRQAFGQIIKSLEARLYRAAFLLCGEKEEAKDLLQETFLNLYQSLPRFQEKSSLYTYSYRILINLNHKRIRKKRKPLVPLPDNVRSPSSSSAASFEREEKNERLRAAINRLPHLLQEAIILRYLEELSYQEIASRLGIIEGTVKSRLHNAKRVLRKIIQSEHF